jgi:hypothetical protein
MTVNAASTVTANFQQIQTVAITITSSITGSGYVTVDGNAITTPQTFNWLPASSHTIASISPVSGGTGIQYLYTSWSDSGAQSHSYTVPGSAVTVTANYQKQYYLTVTSVAGSPTGQGWYNAGATISSSVTSPVTITGPPLTVYTSTGWTGTGSAPTSGSTTSTGNFAINAPSSVTWNWNGQMTLYPNGVGSDGITLVTPSGTAHWVAVSDSSAADTAAYVYVSSNTATYTDYYTLQDHGTAVGTITSVTANMRVYTSSTSGPSFQNYLRIGSSTTIASDYTPTSANTWVTHSDVMTKPGGGTWAFADIDGLQGGVVLNRTSGTTMECTLVWVTIAFTA